MNSRLTCRFFVFAIGLVLSSSASAETPDAKGVAFFENKIRPVLVEQCYRCHAENADGKKKLRGGLRVDTRSGLRKGGDSGPAVVPGDAEKSLLVRAIRHEQFKMPPKGKLPNAVVADFVTWINMGAPDPRAGASTTAITQRTIDFDKAREFWSFRRLQNVSVPEVEDEKWIRTPIDRFIRAAQLAKGVEPNTFAEKRTLVRRVYFDLLGLPPTPAEVDAFIADTSIDAYERLIDRLLDSEHYGERWARHWLDLARFAESNGYAFDKDRANAFHYRDFVIKALNADMPYDEFVRLQVAGDLIAPNDQLAISATGFLVAGPFTTQQTQKERERSRYEQLDDIAHTLGTSLLGLTVGCARCHTHKYDPIPQSDYYQLIASFAEVGFADVALDLEPEANRKAKAAFDAVHAPLVKNLQDYEKNELPNRLRAWLAKREGTPVPPMIGEWHVVGPFPGGNFDQAFAKVFEPEKGVDLTKSYADGKLKWKRQPKWVDGTVHNTLKGANSANYLYRTLAVEEEQSLALSLGSDDGIKLWHNGKEVLANKIGRGAAADQEKVTLTLTKGTNHVLMKIVNGGGPSGFYFQAKADIPPADVQAILSKAEPTWQAKQRKKVLDWFATRDAGWKKLNGIVQEHLKKQPKPKLTMIYAAKKRGSTYNFGANTYKTFHLRRGNPDNKEAEAKPGALTVLGGNALPAKPARLALADWLTDTENGAGHLLARVIVNRLWQHHFGRGIVTTPSDFGTRGEAPTHPQLLEWLASELVRNGWKLKPIHRLIMTSSVYMQAGKPTPTGSERDPENRLYWRKAPRRLEAEVLRDALLAVSGTLDETRFGKGTLDPKSRRRSIYLTVKRSRLIPWMQLFDAPDTMQGIGQRSESTVAPQALALLNSPMVRDLAGKLAQRIRPKPDVSLEEAIESAYHIAFARPATDRERDQMLAFLQRQTSILGGDAKAEAVAMQDFCHLLLCSNEFVYID